MTVQVWRESWLATRNGPGGSVRRELAVVELRGGWWGWLVVEWYGPVTRRRWRWRWDVAEALFGAAVRDARRWASFFDLECRQMLPGAGVPSRVPSEMAGGGKHRTPGRRPSPRPRPLPRV